MTTELVRARRLLVAFVVAVFCIPGLTAFAQSYSVSGTVTLTASRTLPKNRPTQTCVAVTLGRFNGNIPVSTRINTDSSGNGTYTFTGLPAGEYTVGAYAYELSTAQSPATCTVFPTVGTTPVRTYTLKYYDGTTDSQAGAPDQGTANYFTLNAGNPTQSVNFNLVDTTNGSISGQVTGGGAPLASATVNVYTAFGWNFAQSRSTNSSGNYTILGLNPGTYIVLVTPPSSTFAAKQYSNARSRSTATRIAVAGGAAVSNISVSLDAPNGSISGTVKDGSGAPVSNLCVMARDKATNGNVRSGCPDPSTGAYTIDRLAPGTYRLRAYSAEAGFVNQYYGGQGASGEIAEKTFSAGTDVGVTAGQTTAGINITMAANPGRILGTITRSDTKAPIADADISLRTPNGNETAGGDASAMDGSYMVRGVAPGVYKIRVAHPNFVTRWFNVAGGGATFGEGSFVSATANTDTTDINVALDPNPGSITGKVTSDGTTPVAGMSVTAYLASYLTYGVYGATTLEDGSYEIVGLAPGSYVVRVTQQYDDPASAGVPGSAVQYYSAKLSKQTGDPVVVTANTPTPNINFILSPTFASLSGRVTQTDGTTGVEGVGIRAFDAATGNEVSGSATDSSGAFTVSQLPPGTYKVRASALGFADRFFLSGQPGAPSLNLASVVTLTAASDTPGVNIQLARVSGDFNGDGKGDLLWQNQTNGAVIVWYMDGPTMLDWKYIYQGGLPEWKVVGAADFNGDGLADLLWQNQTNGAVIVWYMNAATMLDAIYLYRGGLPDWKVVGAADFNGDGKADLLWQNQTNGAVIVWYMDGTTLLGSPYLYQGGLPDWKVVGAADFNGDGKADLLWQNRTSGAVIVWYMDGTNLLGSPYLYQGGLPDWKVVGGGDFNGDGKGDLLWQNQSTGAVIVWYLDGTTILGSPYLYAGGLSEWKVVGPK